MIATLIFIGYLVFINILAFILYGIDKKKAMHNKSRISEKVLLWMARLGGGLGSYLAMMIFHHKKRHSKFQSIVPLWITIWMFIIAAVIIFGSGDFIQELRINGFSED